MNNPPRYAYAIPILLGLLAAFVPANLPMESPSVATALVISAFVFGLVGVLLGTLWPSVGWRWGLWVVAPGAVLVTIGLISSGEFASFLADDLPFLAFGLIAACLGGTMGARLRGAAAFSGNESSPP